jgi:transposase
MLNAEIGEHDAALDALTDTCASSLKAAFGVATGTVAEMLILVGDNPERIRSEAAFAKLCGVCPVPASSGKTTRHRLNRGGHRQANAALYRVVITRMRSHKPTLAYVEKRLAQGRTKREIVRYLKRYVAREIFGQLCGSADRSSRPPETT